MKEDTNVLTMEQAAEYAGVKVRTVYHAAKMGYLETLPIPARIRLTTREMVDRWMRSPRKRASRVTNS